MSIFKSCDIRGVYGVDIDGDIAYQLGKAIATVTCSKSIVVGGDVRPSTKVLKTKLIDGLVESGSHVIDIGIVPTPALYFAKDKLNAFAAAMVTASHNPRKFNGLKVMMGDMPVTPEEIQTLEDILNRGEFSNQKGSLKKYDILPKYTAFLKGFFTIKPDTFRAVVDCADGCYSFVAPDVLKHYGVAVDCLCCDGKGIFDAHKPNPAEPKNLRHLNDKVKANGADLGIAFDCDGDRVAFVDDRGMPIPMDVIIVILCRHFLKGKAGAKVIYDLKCSDIVPEAISAMECIPVMEKSGHAFIKRNVIVQDAPLGVEASGHIFYDMLNGCDDGLFSALQMLEILSARNQKLSKVIDTVKTYPVTPDIRIKADDVDKEDIILRLQKIFKKRKQTTIDGIKVYFDDGWALARASITEPLLTFRFEGKTQKSLSRIFREFITHMPELRGRIEEHLKKSMLYV